jgi:sugar phosphate isomerase/epimerase
MTVRQGFMIDGACDRPLADAVAFAADRGFDFVELNAEQGYDRRRTDPERIGALADDAGLDLVVHLPYRLDVGSPHEHVREGALRELEAGVDHAAAMGAERAVYHASSDVYPDVWADGAVVEAIHDSARRLHEYGAERGVAVVAENLKGPAFTAADFPTLFARTDATMCLDTGHAHATGTEGPEQAALLREHGDRIPHVHLNDTRREDDDEHLPVGLGRVDFAEIVAAMVETDWTGTCTHEVFGYDLTYAAAGKERFDDLLAAAR